MISFGNYMGRIFSKDKIIPSRRLNVLGLQVFRTLAARSLYNRLPAVIDADMKDKLDAINRDGILVWQDFLPPNEFNSVSRECLNLFDGKIDFKRRKNGPNTDDRAAVQSISPDVIPSTLKLLCDHRLQTILEAAERRPIGNLASLAKVERLAQGPTREGLDSQTELHSDIFFTSHKVWYYLTDVTIDDGPLCFIKGSHHVTARQLFYIYKHSCSLSDSDEPSRRVTLAELSQGGFTETVLTCPRNTLVIANTCGYHRRRQGKVGRERWSIHLELRANPFKLTRADSF